MIVNRADAVAVHRRLLSMGSDFDPAPAGSLAYNILRIRAGRPAVLELSADYIPLEVGLWDEISFSKGCYTGQEIIARMESRQRLAKALVKVALASMVAAPANVQAQQKLVGRLTSSVLAPDGKIYALAVLKIGSAQAGTELTIGTDDIAAHVQSYAGAPPPFILAESADKRSS